MKLAKICAAATLGLGAIGLDTDVTQAFPADQPRPSVNRDAWPDREANCNKAPHHPLTELKLGNPEPMNEQAILRVNSCGINFTAGQQNTSLTITMVGSKIRFHDKGTRSWKRIPDNCTKEKVAKGVAAICSIPKRFADQMFVTVWPRLGNDTVIADTLPARIRMWVLADFGHDTVRTGAGDDFVNGARGNDRIRTGAGVDWVRAGRGNDRVWAGPGNDGGSCQTETRILGQQGRDVINGGPGSDCLHPGPGRDRVHAEDGEKDKVACFGEPDVVVADRVDILVGC